MGIKPGPGGGSSGGNNSILGTMALASRSTSQAILAGTLTDISYDTDLIDTSAIHSTVTNPNRFTAPATGWYRCSINCTFTVAASFFYAFLAKNGGLIGTLWSTENGTGTGTSTTVVGSLIVELNAGDYVTAQLYSQVAVTIGADGGALNAGVGANRFWIERVA